MAQDFKEKLLDLLYRGTEAVPVYIGRGVNAFFKFVLGGTEAERNVKRLKPYVDAVNALEPKMKQLTHQELRKLTEKFKKRLKNGETLEEILPEAFAAVREASVRTTGMRHFDVQIMGGVVLHQGKIAEMATGEGKTLVATLPAYLNALTERGVHIVTVNDYLARRDREWMGPIFELLGLTVGVIQSDMDNPERKQAYNCDITYGTNNEFGFDYLRDNMKLSVEDQVQRELHYAIVDEVDNVLIDEARTPLIISGPAEESPEKYFEATRLARHLRKGIHYEVHEKEHRVTLTEEGIEEAQRYLKVDSFYNSRNIDWPHYIDVALRAKELYKRDKDYVVMDGQVIIVDEFTGRLMPGRRWSDGLHQAVEAKEGLTVREENQTLATITFQNYFKLYAKLAGMTGTAATEAGEFLKIYELEVVVIPTNRPLRRYNFPDLVYGTAKEKWDAVVEEIIRTNKTGRPILVGTTSIENSEMLSRRLSRYGVEHEVLNAKHHEREAKIVARAGQLGAVTIATNMAGRGTDIVLGKQSFEEVLQWWKEHGLAPKDVSADMPREELDRILVEHWAEVYLPGDEPKPDTPESTYRALKARWAECGMYPMPLPSEFDEGGVAKLGGLHVVGTERHEARRIDNQLRGRAGRQGDPGSSRFFVSLDDDLMRIFMSPWVRNLMRKSGLREGEAIESGLVTRGIERAQRRVEEQNFEIRKQLLEYDEVMNEQRKLVYGQRQQILKGSDPEILQKIIDGIISRHIDTKHYDVREYNFNPVRDALRRIGLRISFEEWKEKSEAELVELLIARYSEPGAPAPPPDRLREFYRELSQFFLGGQRIPEKRRVRKLRSWAKKHSLLFDRKKWENELRSEIFETLVRLVKESVEDVPVEEFVSEWTAFGLEQDFPTTHYTERLDYDQFREWVEPLAVKLDVKEWAPLSRSRDRLHPVLLEKVTSAWKDIPEDELKERLIRHSSGIWFNSPAFAKSPTPEHISAFALVRFGVDISPEVFREIILRAIARAGETLAEQRYSQLQQQTNIQDWVREYLEFTIEKELEGEGRNLPALSRELDLRLGLEIPPFELSKYGVVDLREFVLSSYREKHGEVNRREGVEEITLRTIENAVANTVEKFVDPKTGSDPLSRSFEPLSAFANSLGLRITEDDWKNLDRVQLRHLSVRQALKRYGADRTEDIVSRFVQSAVYRFLESGAFSAEHSYHGLADWVVRTFHLRRFGTGLSQQIEEQVQNWLEETRSSILNEMLTYYKEYEVPVEEASSQLVTALAQAYYSTQSGEETDFYLLARVLTQRTSLNVRESDLARAEEGEEKGAIGYLAEKAASTYSHRPHKKLLDDFTGAVFSLFLDSDRFFTEWQTDSIRQWMKLIRLTTFTPDTWQEEVTELLTSHIVSVVQKDYEDRSKGSVIRVCTTSAFETFLDAELSEGGRDFRSLRGILFRKFDAYTDPFELSKMSWEELKSHLTELALDAYRRRKSEIGEVRMLYTASSLMLYILDTKWKDHLYAIDHLKGSIGLRGYAGIDPKIAYKKEAYEMFDTMIRSVEDQFTDMLLKVSFEEEEEAPRASWTVERYIHSEDSAITRHKQAQEQAAQQAGRGESRPKPVRVKREPKPNDPCPCGAKNSNGTPKKYKKCCMVRR